MKKIIALLIAVSITVSSASNMFANDQIAVEEFNIDNVHYVLGENIITGEPLINPTMSVSWEEPSSWGGAPDDHPPVFYEIIVDNKTLNEGPSTIQINSGSDEFINQALNIHNEINLDTGSFYELSIQPYHYHTEVVSGVEIETLAPSSELPVKAYAVTDLQVEFSSDEDSIQVIWDDLGVPEFEYRIIYALGDYTSGSKDTIIDNAEGIINGLTVDSDDVDGYFDPIEQRNKLSYTIDESIYPGQVYSILVEPVAEYYDGQVIARNRNYPFIKSVSTNIQLSLVEEGDYIRLQWEIPASFKVGQEQENYELVEATLMEYQDGLGRNLVIFDGDAATIGYYRIQKPIWETEYELHLTYKAVDSGSKPDIVPVSNRMAFVPSEYQITPTKPYVPNVLSEDILEDLRSNGLSLSQIQDILRADYLVEGDSYEGSLDNLFDENITFHIEPEDYAINYTWGAFRRIDVDVTSSTYGEYITDTNIYYDIWVTDELSTLAYAPPLLADERFTSASDEHVLTDSSNEIIGYRETLNFFYDTEDSEFDEILPNQLYYIKVQAKKVTAQGTLLSEPTISSIYFTYDGATYEPPTVAKPPLHVDETETTHENITLKWKESWHEIIDIDAPDTDILWSWQHQVWVDKTTGEIFSEAKENTEYFKIYDGESEVERLKEYLEAITPPLDPMPSIISRDVTLGTDAFGVSDVQYKFYKVSYEYVLGVIEQRQLVDPTYSFEQYYNDLVENNQNGTAPISWVDIVPSVDNDGGNWLVHRETSLLPNTSYLFILMPYRSLISGEEVYSHYPTPIIVSTDPEDTVVVPDPTVPTLFVTSASDTTVTTTWKYNTDFEYDLMYGLVEDVAQAESATITLPTNILDPNYPTDGAYFEMVVDDLFPLTTYYFWVKARQTDNNTSSQWSNPAIAQTLDTAVPIPPRGVGLAPLSRIDDYGYDNSVSEDYIILEWIKDTDDIDTVESSRVSKEFSYVIEVADNFKFIDPIYIESSGGNNDSIPDDVEILEKNLVKINNLVPNRNYYVRIKTRVRVIGSAEGQLIIKDSESYSSPIRIITLSSGSEYDGFDDPALNVLPDDDYEMIYNDEENRLEFRFRDDSIDSSGASDNNVDQRLISSLIEDKVHEYVINVDSYEGKEIDKRRITIPYTIMEAFDAYQVDIVILAGEMMIDLPANALIDTVNDQVKAFGVAPSVIINIEELDVAQTMKLLPRGDIANVSVPQKLTIQVKSTRKTDNIGYTDIPMTIGLTTSSRYGLYEKDTVIYVKDNNAKWQTATGDYNKASAQMMFETSDIGSYGLYVIERTTAVSGSNTDTNHWSETYRQDVYGQISISGLISYNPSSKVTEKNMIWAAYGSAMGEHSIDLSASLSGATMTTIQRAGLKSNTSQTNSSITREEAISMFVRAYEIANGKVIQVDMSTYNTVVSNSQISSSYKTAIAKAHAIGLITNLSTIRPKESMTYGEFFTVWSRSL